MWTSIVYCVEFAGNVVGGLRIRGTAKAATEGGSSKPPAKDHFSDMTDDVPFYPLPSIDPENILGRTQGGGRYHFQTTKLPDGKGGHTPAARGAARCSTIFTRPGIVVWRQQRWPLEGGRRAPGGHRAPFVRGAVVWLAT